VSALQQAFAADAEFCAWEEKKLLQAERRRQKQLVQHRANDMLRNLLPFLACQFTQLKDAVYMPEMPNSGSYWDCSARFDLAVLADDLYGYEIKTERDQIRDGQIRRYEQLCDFVSLVTVPGRIDALSREVPAGWGIIQARTDESVLHFEVLRHPIRNHPPADALAGLLCCPELLPLVRRIANAERDFPAQRLEALQQTRRSILVAEMGGWERSILRRWFVIALKEHWKEKLLRLSEARQPEASLLGSIDVSDLI